MSGRAIHTFDNGVRMYADQLRPQELARYRLEGLHEPVEEELFLRLLANVPRGGTYVNIGTALGYYPLLGRIRRPDIMIHAYEPLPRHRLCFEENLALNGIDSTQFTIYQEAVSGDRGQMVFVDQGYSSHLLTRRQPIYERLKQLVRPLFGRPRIPHHAVQMLPLDRVLERAGGRIDLLQMDAQGSEADALRVASDSICETGVRALLLATHGDTVHADCLRVLVDHDFDIIANDPRPGATGDGVLAAFAPASSRPRNA